MVRLAGSFGGGTLGTAAGVDGRGVSRPPSPNRSTMGIRIASAAANGESAPALTALAGADLGYIRIRSIVGMPGRAMSSCKVARNYRLGCTQVILPVRDGFQVLWPNAEFHAAEVVNRKAVRDWADEQFVGCPVGKNIPGPRAAATKDAVAASERRARPEPACLGELDFGVETLEQGKLASHLGLILHGVARPGVLAPRPLSIVPDRRVAKWSEG